MNVNKIRVETTVTTFFGRSEMRGKLNRRNAVCADKISQAQIQISFDLVLKGN